MKKISSRTHGYIDYSLGVLLLIAPYLFNFADVNIAMVCAQAIGVLILAQSVLTNYEFGLLKIIPFKTHLALDVVASLFLAVSPFLFSFNDFSANVWGPHVVAGVAYFFISLLTDSRVKATSHQAHNRGPAIQGS
jgi:hypothetical protein